MFNAIFILTLLLSVYGSNYSSASEVRMRDDFQKRLSTINHAQHNPIKQKNNNHHTTQHQHQHQQCTSTQQDSTSSHNDTIQWIINHKEDPSTTHNAQCIIPPSQEPIITKNHTQPHYNYSIETDIMNIIHRDACHYPTHYLLKYCPLVPETKRTKRVKAKVKSKPIKESKQNKQKISNAQSPAMNDAATTQTENTNATDVKPISEDNTALPPTMPESTKKENIKQDIESKQKTEPEPTPQQLQQEQKTESKSDQQQPQQKQTSSNTSTKPKESTTNKTNTQPSSKFTAPTQQEIAAIHSMNNSDSAKIISQAETAKRDIYDYKTEKMPDNISKKEYDQHNNHLPRTFYNYEYSALLFAAVHNNNIQEIKSLLSKNADINAEDLRSGHTPLTYAMSRSKLTALRYLIKRGADVNHQMANGETALHIAVKTNNVDGICILLSAKANTHLIDTSGKNAFHYINPNIDKRTISNIVESYENIDYALIDFAHHNHTNTVEYIINHYRTNANIKDPLYPHDTPLMIAIRNKNMRMVNLLLLHNADPSITNEEGTSALDLSQKYERLYNTLRTIVIKKDLYKM